MKQLKLIIADDNKVYREAISFFIKEVLHHFVIAEFANGYELVESPLIHEASVILMDIHMPLLDGIEATKRIQQQFSHIKILAVTNNCHQTYLDQLVGAGFKGCVQKDHLYEELETAIQTVHSGKFYFAQNVRQTLKK